MARTKADMKALLAEINEYPPRPADNIAYQGGEILDKFLVIGDKPGGVEPGALVVFLEDLHELGYPQLIGMNAAQIKNVLYTNSELFLEEIALDLHKKFKDPDADSKPTVYLIKQDYPDAIKVAPPKERLAKTNAISSLPGILQRPATSVYFRARSGERDEENINALLEVAGNTVAQNYGMPSQEQFVLLGTYVDGAPKVMTISRWEYGLIPLQGCMTGSDKKKHYQNQLVITKRDQHGRPVKNNADEIEFITDAKGQYISEPNIVGMSADFAIAVLMGDRDYFGSKVQNKIGIQQDGAMSLYGFDFGHAFRENPYIDVMDDNFQFNDLKSVAESFKNITIFMDSTMSEKMLGVFYIYRGLSDNAKNQLFSPEQQANIDKVIQQYAEKYPHFAARIQRVEPNAIGQAFDEQLVTCEKMMTNQKVSRDVQLEYRAYHKQLKTAKVIALKNEAKMMQKFEYKMRFSPETIDLLDNLNKLCGNSLMTTSLDGKVNLNHSRFSPQNKLNVDWHFAPRSKTGEFVLVGNCNRKDSKATMVKINIMFQSLGLAPEASVTHKGNQLVMTMPQAQLNTLQRGLDETTMLACRRQYRNGNAANQAMTTVDNRHNFTDGHQLGRPPGF